MKPFLTILILILHQAVFGQFAYIQDPEGFVNVRSSSKISSKIIDTLGNHEIIFCVEVENNWCHVDYNLNQQTKTGYIHKSRVKFIDSFKKVSSKSQTDSTLIFNTDSLNLLVTKTIFNPKSNKLQYHKGNPQENEATYLEKINGKEIWGTDGNIPKFQYGQIILEIGKKKIHLPMENLFEPNFNQTTLNLDEENKTIYISALNSDGAGGYAVLWVIENEIYKQRITTIPF